MELLGYTVRYYHILASARRFCVTAGHYVGVTRTVVCLVDWRNLERYVTKPVSGFVCGVGIFHRS